MQNTYQWRHYRVGVTRGGNWGCQRLSVCQFCSVTPIYFLLKNWRPFLLIAVTFIDFSRMLPPAGCHPTTFYLSDLVCPLFFVNSPSIFFLRASPPTGCHPGRWRHCIRQPMWRWNCLRDLRVTFASDWGVTLSNSYCLVVCVAD